MRNREDSGEKRLNSGHQEYSIPDDLLINILITLPAKDVMRYRCVCRRWRYLTSTSCFLDLFSQNSSSPVTLADEVDGIEGGSKQFMLNNWWRSESAGSAISRFNTYPGYRTQCSGDGLLVLKSECPLREFIVINPVYPNEKITIFVPKGFFWCTEACAIYFHPTLKDYCILWAVYSPRVRYMISSLRSKSCWREIENRWKHTVWTPDNLAVLVNQYIYWLVELGEWMSGIMEFDIISEEFKLISLPSSPFHHTWFYEHSFLLSLRGTPSFFLIIPEYRIFQWTLIDREKQLWTSSTCDINRIDEGLPRHKVRVVAQDGEELLVVQGESMEKRLFLINLKLGTSRQLGTNSYAFETFFPYVISLVSLRNYNPLIRMERKGREDVKNGWTLNSSLKWGNKKKRTC